MLHELRGSLEAAHGLRVHHSAIGYALDRLGYTFKKRSLIADERRKARVRQARADWIKHRLPAMRKVPERLVFIDETSVKTNLTRLRGRAKKGERLFGAAPFGSWNTQTFIAGLTAEGIIAPWVIKGAMPLGECAHSPAGNRWRRVRDLYPHPACPGLAATHRSDPGQSRHPQKRCCSASAERPQMLVPFPAAIQPRPEPDRNGVFKTESTPPQNRRADLRATPRCHR
jgi:hypothetical protein